MILGCKKLFYLFVKGFKSFLKECFLSNMQLPISLKKSFYSKYILPVSLQYLQINLAVSRMKAIFYSSKTGHRVKKNAEK